MTTVNTIEVHGLHSVFPSTALALAIVSVAGPVETDSATDVPAGTVAPAAGVCVTTAPAGTVALAMFVIAPTLNPAVASALVAAARGRGNPAGGATAPP